MRTAEMMREAADLMTQDGFLLGTADPKVRGISFFLTSWANLLKEMACWMGVQEMANILPEDQIIKIVKLHVEVAETYLADRKSSEKAPAGV
jgi:hypothetical protein